ncbi:hypothetical protein MNBD_GAMMA20-1505 [hydrothermal vent metagenome]|uniref:Uncharacterized protein n=1 Tax=hydrothermal vent metagenome TaxID=652676 RepID=A0A3B0ZYZ4_9ZZZZ
MTIKQPDTLNEGLFFRSWLVVRLIFLSYIYFAFLVQKFLSN